MQQMDNVVVFKFHRDGFRLRLMVPRPLVLVNRLVGMTVIFVQAVFVPK
jgi:flagellar biosynthesis protein FliQ